MMKKREEGNMSIPDSGKIQAFHDRAEAGRMLAERLQTYTKQPDVVVCALPRGGVPVAAEIATALEVPLTIFVVRKLGVPGQEEVAMGALCSGGMRLINRDVVNALNIPRYEIEATINREGHELERRERLYARGHPVSELQGKTVIVADDGIATGATITLAVHAIRQRGAHKIVAAVPVAPHRAISQLRHIADEVICLTEPESFWSVGQWYEHFPQLDDQEVCHILDRTFEQLPQLQPVW
jgi:putative phosphoribosyl transferase